MQTMDLQRMKVFGTMALSLINISAFTRGKDQLDPVDVETTRGIANVRIHVERVIVHVERVIGTLRQKYTILQVLCQLIF